LSPNLGRTASPIWPDLIYDRHNEVDQIANDIGMSRQNVEHYMRFRDQMKVGADGQKRLRLVNGED
jgi:hypothetical protein